MNQTQTGFDVFHASSPPGLKPHGDIYRISPNTPHGVRCREHALIVQARA